jgi:hypothetical protein
MRLTNKLGLPSAIVAALENDTYSRGECDLSVTQLIAPPRQVELRRRHEAELEEDVADRIWILLGKSIHEILEKAAPYGSAITEERLFMEIDGWVISGAFDSLVLREDEACE